MRMTTLVLISTSRLAASAAAGCGNTGMGQSVRDDITLQMTQAKSPIARCYETALKANRKLRGMIQLHAIAEAKTGKFINVAIDRNELPDDALAACVIAQVGKLKLAKPTKSKVAISYPLEFIPADLVGKAPTPAPAPPAPMRPAPRSAARPRRRHPRSSGLSETNRMVSPRQAAETPSTAAVESMILVLYGLSSW